MDTRFLVDLVHSVARGPQATEHTKSTRNRVPMLYFKSHCTATATVEPPIKDTPNKGHNRIKPPNKGHTLSSQMFTFLLF